MSSHSPELNDLATALCNAQAEFTAIPKDSKNPFFKSKYADLPTVVATASPILTKHGLSVSQFIGTDEHGDTLTTWLLHKSGQFIAESMRLHISPAKGLSDTQAQGSAVSYARRYSYMSVLGLVADEDDDGNRTARQAPKPPAKPADPPVSSEQIRTIMQTADENGVESAVLANIIKIAQGADVAFFETEDQAARWVDHWLPKMPARCVATVLENIKAESKVAA